MFAQTGKLIHWIWRNNILRYYGNSLMLNDGGVLEFGLGKQFIYGF